MKRYVLLLAGVLIALSGCVSHQIEQTNLYRSYFDEPAGNDSAELIYEEMDGIHVFHLSGGEYAMGYEYGKKAAELNVGEMYTEIFENAARMLKEDAPDEYSRFIDVRLLKELLVDAWMIMEPHVPAYAMEMLQGFAAGSGIPYADVQAMHALPDFTETSCSALWATGSATEDGQPVQIRVLDYIMRLGIQKYPAVVFFDFGQGHTVANIGWLGLLGVISGMNDSGLAVSEMGYGNPDGETFHAIPMPFLLLDILRWCSHPREAEGIIRSNPRTNSYVYIVGTADQGGLAFVTNPHEVEVFEPGQESALVPQLPDSLHAGHYQEEMDVLVAERHGSISAEWLMDSFIPEIAMDSNLQSVVYDLANLRFFLSNAPDTERRACDQPYTLIEFR